MTADKPPNKQKKHQAEEQEEHLNQQRQKERRLFVFIIVFLFPLLAIAFVGAYGFVIWMYQLFAGPPGLG